MQLIGVVAPKPDPIVDRVVSRLAARGSVGVVRSQGTIESPDGPEDTAVTLGQQTWRGVGKVDGLSAVLDRLANTHDAAVAVGFPELRGPQIVVGDTDVRRVLTRVDNPEAIEYDDVLGALQDVQEWESLGSLVAAAKRSTDEEFAGAIATFTGRVRARGGPEDTPTEQLRYERYDSVAEDRLADIRSALESRDGIYEVLFHHRTGTVEAGEDIVFVVVLAGHREEAFTAVEDGINRLKAEVPIFKKEITVEDDFWVHEQ